MSEAASKYLNQINGFTFGTDSTSSLHSEEGEEATNRQRFRDKAHRIIETARDVYADIIMPVNRHHAKKPGLYLGSSVAMADGFTRIDYYVKQKASSLCGDYVLPPKDQRRHLNMETSREVIMDIRCLAVLPPELEITPTRFLEGVMMTYLRIMVEEDSHGLQ